MHPGAQKQRNSQQQQQQQQRWKIDACGTTNNEER